MPYALNFAHYLMINDVPLSTPGWEQTNFYTLYSSANVRGENRIMPGAVGIRALRRRPTETTRTVELVIFGDRSWDGSINADPIAGLLANINHLQANVVDPLATADSTRTAQLVHPDGNKAATVQVLGFEIASDSYGPAVVSASMDIAIIGGWFQ